jgi:hypothetical protein
MLITSEASGLSIYLGEAQFSAGLQRSDRTDGMADAAVPGERPVTAARPPDTSHGVPLQGVGLRFRQQLLQLL